MSLQFVGGQSRIVSNRVCPYVVSFPAALETKCCPDC